MNQTWENNKKTNFGPNFGVFGSNLGPKNFFASFTSSSSYHLMQFKGKLMNQTWENSKRPNSEPDFGLFDPNMGTQIFLQVLPLLVFTHCSKLSSYAI